MFQLADCLPYILLGNGLELGHSPTSGDLPSCSPSLARTGYPPSNSSPPRPGQGYPPSSSPPKKCTNRQIGIQIFVVNERIFISQENGIPEEYFEFSRCHKVYHKPIQRLVEFVSQWRIVRRHKVNKKVLLYGRKRRTARGVSCPYLHSVLCPGRGVPLSWSWPGGDTPVLALTGGGYQCAWPMCWS